MIRGVNIPVWDNDEQVQLGLVEDFESDVHKAGGPEMTRNLGLLFQ